MEKNSIIFFKIESNLKSIIVRQKNKSHMDFIYIKTEIIISNDSSRRRIDFKMNDIVRQAKKV